MLTLVRASTHQFHSMLLRTSRVAPASSRPTDPTDHQVVGRTDRGAVSLEQVLWFVAVAVSVGVVAAILWNRIFDAADDAQLDIPVAPGG